MITQRKFNSAFEEWLFSVPMWKESLEQIDSTVFDEIKMSQEKIEEVLEKLDEYGFFKIYTEGK